MDSNQYLEDLAQGFAKALGRPPDADVSDLETYARGETHDLPNGASLVIWDANSVHDYVFDTGNAVVIRGASRNLKELDDKLLQGTALGLSSTQVLYAGGGGGVAVVSSEACEAVCSRLHRLYAKSTLVVTCTVEAAPLTDAPFGEQIATLRHLLSQERTLLGPDAEPDVPFFASRCEICGRRAAVVATPRGETRAERKECASCHRRLGIGKNRSSEEAEGFEDIAGSSGTLGLIYLDGNGMGEIIRRLKSPLDFKLFSRRIDEALRESTTAVIKAYRLDENRYQKPIAGGDDLILIVPGDHAVPMARDLLHEFVARCDGDEILSKLAGSTPLGAAAGVALGKAKMPVRNLLPEAEDLLKDGSKKRVYKDRVRTALDFNVVDDGTARRSFAEAARFVKPQPALPLSAKPYTLEEFQLFSQRRRLFLKHLGKSQLHAFLQVGTAGPAQLRNHALYQVGRHKNCRDLVQELASSTSGLGDPIVDGDAAEDCFVQNYGGFKALDVGDMLSLEGYWNEPDEEVSYGTV